MSEQYLQRDTYDGVDGKDNVEHMSDAERGQSSDLKAAQSTGDRIPELLRHLNPEEYAEVERKLVRKIDFRLLPSIVIMYIMNYLDRNNIAAARLGGLEKDLNIDPKSNKYQTAVSILFVGYILMQVPSNLFLDKIGKPSLYLPACMVVWGMISALTAACHNYQGLWAVRFFLGFVEAAYFPGCLFFLSSWYTRAELGFRTAILYSGSLISGAFSGLIAAGITSGLDGAQGISAWQWLFIIEGVITIAIAIACFWTLPDFPKTTKWLTDEERAMAMWRLEKDIGEEDWTGSEAQKIVHGLKLCFTDIKMWILMVIIFAFVSAGTVTNFFPTVVATLGYNRIVSLLLTCPPYVLAVITTFLNSWHAGKTGERYFHIVLPLSFAVIAYIIAATTHTLGPRYFAMMLMPAGVYTGYVVGLGWISNTLPRPPAKRAAALAFINAVSNSASIYASYMYPASAGPTYRVAMGHNGAMAALAIIMATVLRFHLQRLNKKLDQGKEVKGISVSEDEVRKAEEHGLPGVAAMKGFRFLI